VNEVKRVLLGGTTLVGFHLVEQSWEGSIWWKEVGRVLLGGKKLGDSTWWKEVGRVLFGGTKLGEFC